MAIGRVDYKKSTNLEPVASAITSMGQSASKKDKPDVLANKIKAISTDATATPSQVLSGQTFYSGGKKQQGNILIAGTVEAPVSISKQSNSDLSVFPPAKYFKGTTESGILLPIGTLRGQGYALQSEVDAKQSEVNTWKNNYNSKVTELANMTTDRDNWKNIANSRIQYSFSTGVLERKVFKFSKFMKLYINNYAVSEEDGWNWFSFSRAGSSIEITLPYVYYSSASPICFRLILGGNYVASTFVGDKKSNRGWMTLDSEYEINGYFKTYVYDPSIYGSIYIKPTAEGIEITRTNISYSETLYYGAWCC